MTRTRTRPVLPVLGHDITGRVIKPGCVIAYGRRDGNLSELAVYRVLAEKNFATARFSPPKIKYHVQRLNPRTREPIGPASYVGSFATAIVIADN